MPVTRANYDHRGGGNYGIVLHCHRLVGERLVYFDFNAQRQSWVIRDFMTNRQLSNNDSILTVAQIEEGADYDEYPPLLNVKNTSEWSSYLLLRTTAVFRLQNTPILSLPNPATGTWRNL